MIYHATRDKKVGNCFFHPILQPVVEIRAHLLVVEKEAEGLLKEILGKEIQ